MKFKITRLNYLIIFFILINGGFSEDIKKLPNFNLFVV